MEIVNALITIECSWILSIRIRDMINSDDPEPYPQMLVSLSYRFTRADWIVFFVYFYFICITVGYGIVAAFVSLLYLWQRGYEFFRMEQNRITDAINESKFEIDGAVWTFNVHKNRGYFSGNVYPPYDFRVELFKNGKSEDVINSVVVQKYSEVKCELKKYILLKIKQ